MPQLPDEFQEDFKNKRETFHKIAEIVLTNHGRQLTTDEIAKQVEPGREGVQEHLRTLEEKGWIDGTETAKTYTWDTRRYNPAEYHVSEAVGSVTAEALALTKRAARSTTELFAVVAIVGLAAGIVFAVSAILAMAIPIGTTEPATYATIGGGFALGSLLTLGLVELKVKHSRRAA